MARRRGSKGKAKATAAPAKLSADEAREAHWLTPGVWGRRCAVCGNTGCEVYRHSDQSALCGLCVERLGIVPLESKAWKRYAALAIKRSAVDVERAPRRNGRVAGIPSQRALATQQELRDECRARHPEWFAARAA